MLLDHKFIIYLVFAIGIFDGCRSKSDDTIMFENYLQSAFQTKLSDKKSSYILVSSSSCEFCSTTVINASLKNMDTNTYYIFPRSYAKHFEGNTNPKILIDSTNKINKLKYHRGNICKIFTSNFNVDSIIYFEIDNIENLLN